MAALLSEFLAQSAKQKWNWGQTDCLMWIADWVKLCRGFDPAAPWRGAYDTDRGSRRIIAGAGGVVALVDRALHGVLHRADAPVAGDICIVLVPGVDSGALAYRNTGSICVDGKSYAVRTKDEGLVISSQFELVAAWRL